MTTTLIIGNGFDLSMGLPTSYNHFIESGIFKSITNESSNSLFSIILSEKQLNNWIDIEQFLAHISKRFVFTNSYAKHPLRDGYNLLKNSLCEYLKTIDIHSYYTNSRRNNAIILFENLVAKLEQNRTDADKVLQRGVGSNLFILDFNYTNTIEFLLKNDKSIRKNSQLKDIRHFKVHGSLDENNIIFGVQDEIDLYGNYYLRKSYQNNYQNFGTNIYQLLLKSDHIIFYGYSLGSTDHTYFKDFISTISTDGHKIIDFYYFQDKYDIFESLEILTNQKVGQLRTENQIRFIDSSKEIIDLKGNIL